MMTTEEPQDIISVLARALRAEGDAPWWETYSTEEQKVLDDLVDNHFKDVATMALELVMEHIQKALHDTDGFMAWANDTGNHWSAAHLMPRRNTIYQYLSYVMHKRQE